MVATFLTPCRRTGTARRTGPGRRRWCRCGSRSWYGRLRVGRSPGPGQGRAGVGRRDLDDVRAAEDRLDLTGDAGVQRADDADDLVVTGELGGGVLADVGLGLVVLGRRSRASSPGSVLVSLACLMARSTEFWMPRPRADRSPDSGAMTPILADLGGAAAGAAAAGAPESPREPQADRASAATASGTPIRTMERWCTDPPGVSGAGEPPGPVATTASETQRSSRGRGLTRPERVRVRLVMCEFGFSVQVPASTS